MFTTSTKAAALCAAAGLALAGAAHATTVVVDAAGNSSTGGSGAATGMVLSNGQHFTAFAAASDLWSAGANPRWANGDGLIQDIFATGTDDSGQAAGTHIGAPFPFWTQAGLTAPYASLVGSIGGVYHLLGRDFDGNAWGDGELFLYFWDENSGDNIEHITVRLGAGVPEPSAWVLMILGFGLAGLAVRAQRGAATAI